MSVEAKADKKSQYYGFYGSTMVKAVRLSMA
jgi:hypothetical protein